MPEDNTFSFRSLQRISPLRTLIFALVLMHPPLFGCAPTATIRGGRADLNAARLLPYDGPKARLAVARFDDKTAKGYGSIGDGLATMFVTALVNSNRYIVLERDIIDEIIAEQDLVTAGRISAVTGAPTGEIEGAELLLTGAVTEFEPKKFGVGGGIVGLGTLIGSALLHEKDNNVPVGAATYTESHIAIDVRLIDAATSRILASVSVEGRGQDWGGFVAGEVGGGKSRLPLAFGGFQNAAAEKAVRSAINLAVAAVVAETPHSFYRHSDNQFASGRIAGFSYLDLAPRDTASFTAPGATVAAGGEEWDAMALALGLEEIRHTAPVDFRSSRVVAVAAGTQSSPGLVIAIEKAVRHSDRVEITASLAKPAGDSGKEGDGGTSETTKRQPVVLLAMEKSALPVTVTFK